MPVCKFFMSGRCKFGNACMNEHVEELLMPVCVRYMKGDCVFGNTCRFRHIDVPVSTCAFFQYKTDSRQKTPEKEPRELSEGDDEDSVKVNKSYSPYQHGTDTRLGNAVEEEAAGSPTGRGSVHGYSKKFVLFLFRSS